MMQRRLFQTLVNGRSRGSSIRTSVVATSESASNTRGFGSTSTLLSQSRTAGHRPHDESSLVVVGSGVAGCSTALIAAERYDVPVTLLCAGSLPTDCNSYWAQGGIIYRNYDKTSGDSVHSLSSDVHRAGDGLCVNEAVLKLAQEGPTRVRELLLGSQSSFADVPFERDEHGSLKLCLEASHSASRIIYKADHSGKAITEHIVQAALNHPRITVHTNTIVTDLVLSEQSSSHSAGEAPVCLGATVYNTATKDHRTILSHKGVTLASGGLAGIYTHSTNPPGFNALGSSAALALRSKHTKLKDLEYVQFHPTALKIPGEPCFLLTEALRGEDAKLTTSDGHHFAKSFHPHGELAPRDIVARGVYAQSQVTKDGNVYLDISHRDADWLRGRFPSICEKLMQDYGMDLTSMKIPITPAAHYTCGGIVSDEHGRTTVANLYVAGEAARTGLHGGNRLASTSLLEALVWGASVGDYVGSGSGSSSSSDNDTSMESRVTQEWARDEIEHLALDQHPITARTLSSTRSRTTTNIYSDDNNNIEIQYEATQLLNELKTTMWNKVGVVRTPAGLREAVQTLSQIRQEAEILYQSQLQIDQAQANTANDGLNVESIMVRDASYAGLAVAESALRNKESAGAHYVVLAEQETNSNKNDAHEADSDSDGDEDEQERVAMVAAAM